MACSSVSTAQSATNGLDMIESRLFSSFMLTQHPPDVPLFASVMALAAI
jgi:hypothetical protein